MNIYSIRDQAAEFFITPFFAKTDAQAKRMFVGSLGDSFPYRRDFVLYQVGSFDTDDGLVVGLDTPRVVLAGSSVPDTQDPRFIAAPGDAAPIKVSEEQYS